MQIRLTSARWLVGLVFLGVFGLLAEPLGSALAAGGPPAGRGRHGWGHGRQAGRGQGAPWGQGQGGPGRSSEAFEKDRDTFHFLLDNRASIERTVKQTKEGVETVTESDDPAVAARIQEHVAAMVSRVEEGRPIHMRDPLFRAIFSDADKIEISVEKTEKGVRVKETSQNAFVAKLIQAHAKVVSLFIENGHVEASRNHAVPDRPDDGN